MLSKEFGDFAIVAFLLRFGGWYGVLDDGFYLLNMLVSRE